MNVQLKAKLAKYIDMLDLHRGESRGAYNAVADVYDDFAYAWDNFIAKAALAQFHKLVDQKIKPGSLVLDAGCGTGERTKALLTSGTGARVIALDDAEAMLAVAEHKIEGSRAQFVQGDVGRLPFPVNTFDLVACTWVVEIMADPRQVVQEYVRVIKPDGLVIYAFCSLPAGKSGQIIQHLIDAIAPEDSPLSHLLNERDWPFHDCSHSSLKQFASGLVSVAAVAKCCPLVQKALPCKDMIT